MEAGASNSFGLRSLDTSVAAAAVSLSAQAMTYDDVFPGLPETVVNAQRDKTIGKWNNKLRVGSRNVTQVNI